MGLKTLSDIVTEVRDHLDESSGQQSGFWTPAEVIRAVNTAKNELVDTVRMVKKDYFQNNTTIALVAGQTDYDMPTNFQEISAMSVTTTGFQYIRFLPMAQSNPSFQEGIRTDLIFQNPGIYWVAIVNEKTLRFSPVPRQVLNVRVDYVAVIADYSADTDTRSIPDTFIRYIIARATYLLLLKLKDGSQSSWLQESERIRPQVIAAADERDTSANQVAIGFLENY